MFYLIFPLLKDNINNYKSLFIVFVLTITSQVLTMILTDSWKILSLFPLNWLFFFCLGIFIAKVNPDFNVKNNNSKKIIMIIIFFLIVVELVLFKKGVISFNYMTITTRPEIIVLTVCLILLLSIKNPIKNNRLIQVMNRHSYGIYLSHPFLLLIIKSIYYKVGFKNTIGVSFSSFLIVILIEYVFFSNYEKVKILNKKKV
ncbi:MAG TPA: hypothetical protein DIS85_06175 [Vagococcus sp.]|nr:hypothetical protein [Vagococcus sp.]